MNLNPVTAIDGYKVDHRRQYPDNTEVIFSNLTSRNTRRDDADKMVFFGLQYFIKDYLINNWNTEFFNKPKAEVVARFARTINNYLGPNNVGTKHIEDLHDLGYLPIKIMALPEGTVYPLRVPCMAIFNTHEDFFWLTNYLETILSATVWGMCTSATTAHTYKKLLTAAALETVGNADFVQWQGHDFSFRGMFGLQAAAMSGSGHALSFTGSDTIPVMDFLEEYYNANSDFELIIGSVAATEHSVMCAGGMANELETFRRLLRDLYPTGIVSIVSDSWDFWKVMTEYTVALKDLIMSRNGKTVFRPDTGDPADIVCGTAIELASLDDDAIHSNLLLGHKHFVIDGVYYTAELNSQGERAIISYHEVEPTPEMKGAIVCLWEVFGGTLTDKGYKVLDEHVGLIYGDAITRERARDIIARLKAKGFASINVVFGIGSFTYQYVTRDTDGYAVKATFAQIDGVDHEIFKAPKTGDGTKNSAKGLVAVFKDVQGEFYLKDQATWGDVHNCEFVTVFENSILLVDDSLAAIRGRLASYV